MKIHNILRMAVVEDNNCSSLKEEFRNLNNAEKAMIWKDRLIADLKSKNFTEEEYFYISKMYSLINSKVYIDESEENEEAKNEILLLWEQAVSGNLNLKNLTVTLLRLTDNIVFSSEKGQEDPVVNPFCDCEWGGYCNCQWITCKPIGGCGPMGLFTCHKKCGTYY